ncbi:MAG: GumC family protein [Candidatus Eiseniibacteriota bacterium]
MSDSAAVDLLTVARKRARFLILNIAITTALAIGLSFLLPKWYTARTVLLPPSEDESVSFLSQVLPRGLGGLKMPGAPTMADAFVAVLKSRSLADRIVERFHLVERYKCGDAEMAVKALAEHVAFRVGDEGTIAILVEDKDPKTAADMANAFVQELDRFNMETRTSSAKRTRVFVEDRLNVTKQDLAAAEDRLREYQQSRNLPAISPTDKGDADVGARLMAEKIALEVRLQVLQQSLAEDSEEVRRVRQELAAIERQVGGLPKAGIEIMRLWRDVKVEEQVYELLTAQLEEARIRETRDTPTVEVLDPAKVPLHKSRPKRSLIALAGFFLGALGGVGYVLLERRPRG